MPLLPVVAYFGWQKWLVASPQLLPKKSNGVELFQGNYYEVTILPEVNRHQLTAQYRIWIPKGVQTIRGLIVKQHGCGDAAAATGLDQANDLQWQALARKHQMALLGPKLSSGYPMCTDEALKDRATEQSFLKALTVLAQKSQHSELDKVPWVLWGHSGGADWAMQMLYRYPERVVAVVNIRSGGILASSGKSEMLELAPQASSRILSVPVLWAIGEKDPNTNECVTLPKQVFSKFKKAGANWAIVIGANNAHEAGDTRFLAIPYLDAILGDRLVGNDPKLRPVNITQAWLGNPETKRIAPLSQFPDNALEAAWLPDQVTAQKWQEHGTNGKISPRSKPAAPVDVRVTKSPTTGVVVAWHFVPDLENGLPSFRIYRNDALIATLQGQQSNFGDAPEPPQLSLEFYDKGNSSQASYSVSAFNALGESISQPAQFAHP